MGERLISDTVSFAVTQYKGFEEEVQRLRNLNRPFPQTRGYLDWRYTGDRTDHPALIFWAQLTDGKRVGMAGIAFRKYWIDGNPQSIAVLGDISLDAGFRGTGVARDFFCYINAYLNRESCQGLVLPNQAAMKSLAKAGWIIGDTLVSYVCLLDPEKKIASLLKNNYVAVLLSKTIRPLISSRISSIRTQDYSMRDVDAFDESFEQFWQGINKRGLILRDRSFFTLRWRYAGHPECNFKIAQFYKEQNLIGYIIYQVDAEKSCIVEDLLVEDKHTIKPLAALFLKNLISQKKVASVRIKMNQKNPYSPFLRKAGFFQRKSGTVFQLYNGHRDPSVFDNLAWHIMSGDKDV
jgi:hypothetical protein